MPSCLDRVHPLFRDVVFQALSSDAFSGTVELKTVSCKETHCFPQKNDVNGHYFVFGLPYAGTIVEWEILFSLECPTDPPDFVCVDDIEHEATAHSKLIKDWNFHNICCLEELLKELMKIYSKHQLFQAEELQNYIKIEQNYTSLLEAGISQEQIEICLFTKTKRANILVNLCVNDQDLPAIEGVKHWQVFAGLLYSLATNGNILSQALIISPYLEKHLGSLVQQLRISSTIGHPITTASIVDFATSLNAELKQKQEEHKRRRDIVAALLDLYLDNVVFYDERYYSQITLLFRQSNKRYVADVRLDNTSELTLIAPDLLVKVGLFKTRNVPFNQTIPLAFLKTCSKTDLHKHIFKNMTILIKRFMDKSAELSNPTT